MMRVPALAALALPLAACGSDKTATAPGNAAAADDYVARIRALPQAQRDGVLLRAIRDAGRECQQVTASTAVADAGGAPTWTARCDDGTTWVVAINPGGIATVTNAADVAGSKGG